MTILWLLSSDRVAGTPWSFWYSSDTKAIDVKPAELRDDKIGICRRLELDGDIRFQSRDVGLLHRAAKIDGDLPVGFLEIDQPRKNPEIARTLGHGDAYRAGGIVR